MNLKTPLGEIEIFIDNSKIEYNYKKLENDCSCENLDGRYVIKVIFEPDGNEHKISYRIKNYIATAEDDVETGENLELKSFFKNNIKLSIGMVGDTGYDVGGERVCNTFDYDNDYLKNGVEYCLLNFTTTKEYKFGIAWIENYTDENKVQTWYGADPFTM